MISRTLVKLIFVWVVGHLLLASDRANADCSLPLQAGRQFNLSSQNKVIVIGRLPQQHYVVVVPGEQPTLEQVREHISDAFLITSSLGNYVQAGAFFGWQQAKCLSDQLRSRRLDARVVYFP